MLFDVIIIDHCTNDRAAISKLITFTKSQKVIEQHIFTKQMINITVSDFSAISNLETCDRLL